MPPSRRAFLFLWGTRRMAAFKRIMIVCLSVTVSHAAEIIDGQLGYSVLLPEHWVREVVNDTSHRFIDTTGTYPSIVALVRSDFSGDTIFESPEEWTRANFIAYSFVVDADPFSVLVFYDTVTVRQNGTLWAADAFTATYSVDTQLADWAEYIRFTASGSYGFELYAIGALDDMNTNAPFYRSIIDSITITVESPVILPRPAASPAVHSVKPGAIYRMDLLGRRICCPAFRRRTLQVIVAPDRHVCVLR